MGLIKAINFYFVLFFFERPDDAVQTKAVGHGEHDIYSDVVRRMGPLHADRAGTLHLLKLPSLEAGFNSSGTEPSGAQRPELHRAAGTVRPAPGAARSRR